MQGRELRDYLKEYEDVALFSVGFGGMLGGAVGYFISAKNVCGSLLTNATKVVDYMPKSVFFSDFIYAGAGTLKDAIPSMYFGEMITNNLRYAMSSQYFIPPLRALVESAGSRADAQQVEHATKIIMEICQSQFTKDNLILGGYGIGALLGVIFTVYHIHRDNQYAALQQANDAARKNDVVIQSFKETEETHVTVEPAPTDKDESLSESLTEETDELREESLRFTSNDEVRQQFIAGVIDRLNRYRTRIEEAGLNQGFSYFGFLQAANRRANYELAGTLIAKLNERLAANQIDDIRDLFAPDAIADLRKEVWSFSSAIHSQELNQIISDTLCHENICGTLRSAMVSPDKM